MIYKTGYMNNSKVLIVDDDTDDVGILADAFTQSGVESVHYVHSVMQAFMYLESIDERDNLPRLIVTDLYLPGITGTEFLKDLKGMDKYNHIYVIVLSSTKTKKQIEEMKAMEAEDYLIKPSGYNEYLKVALDIKKKLLD